MATRTIDLNCDMGESFGAWTMGQDEAVLPHVSSVNVACGFHAGDPDVMLRTVRAAHARGVAIGAHVSLPDLQGFGRREMKVSADEVYALTAYQVGALAGIARAAGASLNHVKAHGALYNQLARDAALARAHAQAVRDAAPGLVLYALAGSVALREARTLGVATAGEAFADRRYDADGSLAPRRDADAVIHDPETAAAQLVAIVDTGKVFARDGSVVAIEARTICVHGDRADAAAFARTLRARLDACGVVVRAVRGAA